MLYVEQKQCRMDLTHQEMLMTFNNDSHLLKKAVTGDESWLYGHDVETKTQSAQQKSPEMPILKKACQVRSNENILLTVFYDCNGMVHHNFLPQGRTANKEYYFEIMTRLLG